MLSFVRRGRLALAFVCLAAPAGAAQTPADSTLPDGDPLAWARASIAARAAADAAAAADSAAAAWAALTPAQRTAHRDAERRETMGHRFYPAHAEELMNAQAAVVRRAYAGARRRTRHYFPAIERALARQRLPEDLKYVAVVESALDPHAVSPAGAEGMWQFMPETQADYGLDSLSVRDPAQSTAAAVQYLRRLGRQFGDWQLALAAYNCGPSRVRRAVNAYEAETGEPATFWAIRERLPRETQLYVPRWIALAEWLDG